MKLTNETYDALKWTAQILLPAIATLYSATAAIWGLPHAVEIVGTLSAIDVFLGAILGISAIDYDGDGKIDKIAYEDKKKETDSDESDGG